MTERTAIRTFHRSSPQAEWQAAREESRCQGKGCHPRTRRARRRTSPAAEVRIEEADYVLEGAGRQGDPARPVRGRTPAAPLSLHVRPEPRRGLPRLLDVRRPDRPPGPPARARHVLRARLARADREDRGVPQADGLDDPVVLVVRERLQRRLRRRPGTPHPDVSTRTARRSASACSFATATVSFAPTSRRAARSRGARQRLDLPRPDAARPPGELGGLTRRAPADPALRVVAAATTNTRTPSRRSQDGQRVQRRACSARDAERRSDEEELPAPCPLAGGDEGPRAAGSRAGGRPWR